MKYMELLDYDAAYQSLEHLTVGRAVYYLTYIFDCGAHEVYVNGKAQAITDVAYDHSGLPANRMGVWFWGGPPGGEEWFEGSFLTLLMDKLFYSVVMGFDDLIEKFLETLNGGKYSSTHAQRVNCV